MTTLQWEKPPHTIGKAATADHWIGDVYCRYLVRRVAPHDRRFKALRDGELFDKTSYPSYEAAIEACEIDADAPKSSVKLHKALLNA